MRKGQQLINPENQLIYFVPTNPIIEEFRDIKSPAFPEVIDYYMISNLGRIWHKYNRVFLSSNVDARGYMYKPLATTDGNKNFRVHRLVMGVFCYYEGCEFMDVNHKDGIKTNNCIWNLEWVTRSENTNHAIAMGLKATNRLDNAIVHQICKYLEDQNNKITDIAKWTGTSVQIVSSIQQKRAHTRISDQYNIQQRKINNNFTIDQVHALCKYYSENPIYTPLIDYVRNGLISIGFSDPIPTTIVRAADKILKKETYQYVSRDYNF